MAVAAYTSKAAAERDFQKLSSPESGQDQLAAALVEKGADGRLTVDRYHGASGRPAGGLVVLAAPLGILFLVPVVVTRTAWAGVGAIVAHLWHDVPKGDLRHMSDL